MQIEDVRAAMLIGMFLIVAVMLIPDKFSEPKDPPWVKRETDDEHTKHQED